MKYIVKTNLANVQFLNMHCLADVMVCGHSYELYT